MMLLQQLLYILCYLIESARELRDKKIKCLTVSICPKSQLKEKIRVLQHKWVTATLACIDSPVWLGQCRQKKGTEHSINELNMFIVFQTHQSVMYFESVQHSCAYDFHSFLKSVYESIHGLYKDYVDAQQGEMEAAQWS